MLVAHDLSVRSEIALVRAARLAREREGHLTIVHVVGGDLPAPAIDAQRTEAKYYIESEVRRWVSRDKPACRIEIVIGDPAQSIASMAESIAADLVVAGRHRRRAIADMFKGTTVERLLRQIGRPVLIVNNGNQSPYRRVLIPVDFSDASTAAIRFAADLLPEASLHLLHARRWSAAVVGAAAEEATETMSRMIDTLALSARRPIVTVRSGEVLALIKEELARQKTDLVAMGTHTKTGVLHALTGSVAVSVLGSSACDVLVVPVHGPS